METIFLPDTPPDEPEEEVVDEREPDDFEPYYDDFAIMDWQGAGVDW